MFSVLCPGVGAHKIDDQMWGPTRPRMLRMPKNGTVHPVWL